MKKIIVLLIVILFITVGCSVNNNAFDKIKSDFKNCNGYRIKGKLKIYNNEDNYTYDVDVSYKKDDYYKVILTNNSNDHSQIILKNDDGVYVITPSINRSFKFQNDWPNDKSQIYLINSLINDIKNDDKYILKNDNNSYIFKTKVNYPNNKNLVKQDIIFDKKYKLKSVNVYDDNNNKYMIFDVDNFKYNEKFSNDYFDLDNIDGIEVDTKETASLDDIIYPLYLPVGTKLIDETKVPKDNGERVIMTYDGEKSFVLVEETLDVFDELTIIPSLGEPFQLLDTLGVIYDNSLSWSSANRDFYLVSDVMSSNELVDVAESIISIPSLK